MSRKITADKLIGKHVKYYDFLDDEHYGTIVAFEPYIRDPSIAYVYIEDEVPEYNEHRDVVNGVVITYAEIRLSTEVYIDEE